MFQMLLLLSISLTLKLINAETTENIAHNDEHDTSNETRSGIVSYIVGGLVEPLNILLPGKTKDIIVHPIKDVADTLDSNLKVIYPGKLYIRG
jgi:hypothetical protein